MTDRPGKLFVVGLGPGAAEAITPQAADALARATDIVGYAPYLARIPERKRQTRHASDNREELARARHALSLVRDGRTVAAVSSGDAGVFAMASTVFEALEEIPDPGAIDIEIVPGVSAMLAAAARVGAPLGHDFCAISLSDNLKPWPVVVRRLEAAAKAGFVIALYNPVSKARPWQLGEALKTLQTHLAPETPVVFATAVTRPEERIEIRTLSDAKDAAADMRTLVIVGSEATRIVAGETRPWVYTPRRAGETVS